MSDFIVQRRKRKPIAEMNVVPYIDVMLVLLIIFMITAGLISQGVEVDLPQAEAASLGEDKPLPLVATVNKEGVYFLSVEGGTAEEMSPVDLATMVAAHIQLDPETPVVVRGDREVEYAKVVQLMVLLQRAGVPSVGLMTEAPE
ncbi:MAG: TolA energization system membrane component TolR [Idiomarinaceae bacterium HL-53]|nr:MAG: TolA energization system membrane component TolR [Idiomarinaceae bacterium HL-53]CUS48424.1 Cell division and transport-associated protein TolR (TC 2.C.1.2.1) [Idiomarinaceae bacterium HL-53]